MADEIMRFELAWSHYSGAFGRVGAASLFASIRGLRLPPPHVSDTRVCVVAHSARDDVWTEYSRIVADADARAFARTLDGLQLIGSDPRVEPVVDTSDGWDTAEVQVRINDRARCFDVHAQSSGFKGPDADAVRSLFLKVFELAGYRDYDRSFYAND